MRMTASWFEPDIFRVHRIQGCEAMVASQTASSPQIDGRNAAQPRRNEFLCPVADQLSAVLGRVKRWVPAVLAMLARKGGLRVAPCGSAPAAKRRRF
jgi:hypothetical protein